MTLVSAVRAAKRAPFLQVVKSIIAAIGAWLVAEAVIPGPPPVFAAIAALLVVQPSVNQSLSKAIERSTGVVLGVLIASGLGLLLGQQTWVVLVAIAVAFLLAWALRTTTATANQVAISALLVLSLGVATPGYAGLRVVETLVGVAAGMIVNLTLVPLVLIAPAERATAALGAEVAASLRRLATALLTPQTPQNRQELLLTARLMRPMNAAAEAAIAAGVDSLALNPRAGRRRRELQALRARVAALGPIVTQTIGMTRAVVDLYDDDLRDDPAARAISAQLQRVAHDVELALAGAGVPRDEQPVLTAPLTVISPPEHHWTLVGSLLVDLHRIHEAVVDLSETPA